MNHRRLTIFAALALLCIVSVASAQKNSSNEKRVASTSKSVDTGTFSIQMNGRQVAKETFQIDSQGGAATIHSELHYADGPTKAEQSSDLQLGANGTLKKYTWKETSPGASSISVEPLD